MRKILIGKGLIEIVVVVIVVAFFLSLFWPRCGNRARSRQTTCTSNLRHIAMASLMFCQDNNEIMPGLNDKKNKKYVGWVKNVLPYIKGADVADTTLEIFSCPESKRKSDVYSVSYAYNASLLKTNGMGIDVGMINSPEKIGTVCDAEPMQNQGGLIGGSEITGIGPKPLQLSVKPVSRHPIGTDDIATIVGYADGHAQSVVGKYDENDKENGVNKAFYRAVELGYIKKSKNGR